MHYLFLLISMGYGHYIYTDNYFIDKLQIALVSRRDEKCKSRGRNVNPGGQKRKPGKRKCNFFDAFVKEVAGWLSKNFDRQDVVLSQARDYTCSMSSVWKSTTTQDIGTFYDAIFKIDSATPTVTNADNSWL